MPDEGIYRKLQQHLDHMPVPFPASASGVEIRILKHLFTLEEASVALLLSAIPEPLPVIHRRAQGQMGRAELEAILERMAEKGSIHRLPGKRGPVYGKLPLVLGMYEAQVDRLTPELERDVRAYFDGEFGRESRNPERTPQMRTVPVNQSIKVEWPVASHEDIRKYVESSPGPFAAINCICRQGKDLTGESCKQTKERRNCLMIGVAAEMTTAKGIGQALTRDEMLAMLEQADRDGLVLQPQNTQAPMFVCCCCGCCCGVLTTARKLERPVDAFQSGFVAEVDVARCEMCGTCAVRCQMDAIADSDQPPVVEPGRCIGCGLCVTTCPTGAMQLRELEGKRPPPENVRALYTQMYQERFGRAGLAVALAGHLLGRQV